MTCTPEARAFRTIHQTLQDLGVEVILRSLSSPHFRLSRGEPRRANATTPPPDHKGEANRGYHYKVDTHYMLRIPRLDVPMV